MAGTGGGGWCGGGRGQAGAGRAAAVQPNDQQQGENGPQRDAGGTAGHGQAGEAKPKRAARAAIRVPGTLYPPPPPPLSTRPLGAADAVFKRHERRRAPAAPGGKEVGWRRLLRPSGALWSLQGGHRISAAGAGVERTRDQIENVYDCGAAAAMATATAKRLIRFSYFVASAASGCRCCRCWPPVHHHTAATLAALPRKATQRSTS